MRAKATNDVAVSDWLIEDDLPDALHASGALDPWRVLIVDDDVDVHVVTKFSLSNASFMGRRLSFLHAYSGAEALTLLGSTPDVAMVLLDVIMETDDAGLRLIKQIRNELGNKLVRIVLRTGQPGQALEHGIILDYDISDFWCKTDLTTRKLFTTVISSLRTYADLLAQQQQITALNAALTESKRIGAALEQHALLLTVDQNAHVVNVSDLFCATLQCQPEDLFERPIPCPQDQQQAISTMLAQQATWACDLTLQAADGSAHLLRTTFVPLPDDDTGQRLHLVIATTPAQWLDWPGLPERS
jgi:CheY-like chemotaxis protein